MNTLDAIAKRRSVRAFSARAVPVALIEQILSAAATAPSGGNMQPWQVAVVRGETKRRLAEAHIEAAQARRPTRPEIPYYPEPMPAKYTLRRHRMGVSTYHARGIRFSNEFVDWPAVIEFVTQNYHFFGADAGLLFFLERELCPGSLLDIGMFMQNIMLAAQEHGLATCAQASWGNYPDLAKATLGIGDEMQLICGMSLGWPRDDPFPEREVAGVGDFVRWYA